MIELGQLEARHADFAAQGTRIVAASLDDREHTAQTQAKFPHLLLISDAKRTLAGAANVIGPQHSPQGEDTAAPTTFLIDGSGNVRWLFRPDRYIERLTPEGSLTKLCN